MHGIEGFGGIFFLIWLVCFLGGIAGFVMVVIALWRSMQAQESIAQTLKLISDKLGALKP